jgi:hypothetical protein
LQLFLLFVPRLSEIEAAEINIFDSSADASSIKICELLISLFLKFSIFFCISGDKRAAWNSAKVKIQGVQELSD